MRGHYVTKGAEPAAPPATPLIVLRLEAAEARGGLPPRPAQAPSPRPMFCPPMQEGGWARPWSANIKSWSRNLCTETREAPGGGGAGDGSPGLTASLALTLARLLLTDGGVRAGQAAGLQRPYPLWAHRRLPEPSLLPAPQAGAGNKSLSGPRERREGKRQSMKNVSFLGLATKLPGGKGCAGAGEMGGEGAGGACLVGEAGFRRMDGEEDRPADRAFLLPAGPL